MKNRLELRILPLIIFILHPSSLILAQANIVDPKWEVRAVWITTLAGADWPKSINITEQKNSLLKIFDVLKEKNFNTIYFQVRPRGNTFYHSLFEPWASELVGKLGNDPGWDPLEFAIEQAHKRGMELHAWFNVAKVWTNGTGAMPPASTPRHVVHAHPQWVKQYNSEWWIDMGNPDAREYTEDVVMELVRGYDIDGIQFDYLRYPGKDFDDWQSFRIFSDGVERDEWRRNNINMFVRSMYRKIITAKKYVKIGSAPLGIYKSIPGAQSSFTGYDGVYQDARQWLKEGVQDYIVPQLYWDFGEQQNPNDPDFAALCRDWCRENFNRHIIAGLGVYRPNIYNEVIEQILYARKEGAHGESFFRYENIEQLQAMNGVYRYPSLAPAMRWKDSIPPLPPKEIEAIETQSGASLVRWKIPDAARDGEKPFRFVVYGSKEKDVDINNPKNIAAILSGTTATFLDAKNSSLNNKMFYTVTSLDRANNESTSLPAAFPSELASVFLHRAATPLLAQNFPNPFSKQTYISYEVPVKNSVVLRIQDSSTRKVFTLVNGSQEAGTYIVAVDSNQLTFGKHEYILQIGDNVATKILEKKEN